jgi:hypothetical protein
VVACPYVLLVAWAKRAVGLDPQVPTGKLGMALVAISLFMASLTTLRVIRGLDGMLIDPVTTVTLRFIVAARIFNRKVIPRTAA